jgi:hypothetical protein
MWAVFLCISGRLTFEGFMGLALTHIFTTLIMKAEYTTGNGEK